MSRAEKTRAGGAVRVRTNSGVAWVELRRPHVRNALSVSMTETLAATLEGFSTRRPPHVVVLTGAGSAFCSGADIKEIRSVPGAAIRIQAAVQNIGRILQASPFPTIAAVNGPAVGAGFGIAMMCDIRIASETAMFRDGALQLGLVSGHGGVQKLIEAVGMSRATEIMLLDETIGAGRALELGIVRQVVPADELVTAARRIARVMAGHDPLAVRLTRESLRISGNGDLEATWSFLRLAVASLLKDGTARPGRAPRKDRI